MVNRSGNSYHVLASQVGKKVIISRESVVVDMGDAEVWRAALELLGRDYVDDATRGIFHNVDPEILEGLRDFPAGHC